MRKYKIGECVDCLINGDNSQKPLIKDRCESHYWRYRSSLKKPKEKQKTYTTISRGKVKQTDPDLQKWFELQVSLCYRYCECCGEPIFSPSKLNIAHILPKRENKFPEVKTHPLNVIYLCWDCHTNYDNQGESFALKMPCLNKMKSRVLQMQEHLSISQWQRIPEYLKFNYEK